MGKQRKQVPHKQRAHGQSAATKRNVATGAKITRKPAHHSNPSAPSKRQTSRQRQEARPVIPFHPRENILLVGEGDFSFAGSLVEDHKCRSVTATCYDSEELLHQKYPQTRAILTRLLSGDRGHRGYREDGDRGVGAMDDGGKRRLVERVTEMTSAGSSNREENEGGVPASSLPTSAPSSPPVRGKSTHATEESTPNPPTRPNPKPCQSPTKKSNTSISIHTSISASKLHTYRPIRRSGPYNKIIFNFPHVGGLSTDVNRQVRANQELLVAFFESCKGILASQANPARHGPLIGKREKGDDDEDEDDGDEDSADTDAQRSEDDSEDSSETDNTRQKKTTRTRTRTSNGGKISTTGQLIISLFDGAPYSLWSIRDLARHSGYRVVTSWPFPWRAYPGYRHSRTAGEIDRKKKKEKKEKKEKTQRQQDNAILNDGHKQQEEEKGDEAEEEEEEEVLPSDSCDAGQRQRQRQGQTKMEVSTNANASAHAKGTGSGKAKGKGKGFWRGEEREARGFVFELVERC